MQLEHVHHARLRRLTAFLLASALLVSGHVAFAQVSSAKETEDESASDILCEELKGTEEKLCRKVCFEQPATLSCLVFLRFGSSGVVASGMLLEDPSITSEKLSAKAKIAKQDVVNLRYFLEASGKASAVVRTEEERRLSASFHRHFVKGTQAYRSGNVNTALSHYQKGLTHLKKMPNTDKYPIFATAVTTMGTLYKGRGEYREALEHYETALAIRKRVYGGDHPKVASSLYNIAGVYFDRGEYPESLEHHHEALAIRTKVYGNEHPKVAESLNYLGLVHKTRGEHAEALDYYRMALAIRMKNKVGRPLVAQSLNNIGMVHYERGEHAKALEYLQKALAIRKKEYGEESTRVATTRNNIGMVHDSRGEHAKALEQFRKALAIWKNAPGGEHAPLATVLNNIGMVHVDRGEHDLALEHLQKALAIDLREYGEDHPSVATTRNNIAIVHSARGEFAKALEQYRMTLAIQKRVYAGEHPHVAMSLGSLAVLLAAQNERPAASKRLRAALEIRYGHFLANVEAAETDIGIRKFLGTNRHEFQVLLSMQRKDVEDALASTLRWHGLATRSEQVWRDRQRLLRQVEGAERGLIEEHRELQHRRLRLIYVRAENEKERTTRDDNLAKLDQKIAELDERLEKKVPAFAAQRKMLTTDTDGVCAVLRKTNKSLVSYVSYDRYNFSSIVKSSKQRIPSYAAFVVVPKKTKGCTFSRHDFAAKDVDEAVDAYRKQVSQVENYYGKPGKKNAYTKASAAMDEAGKTLRKLVWDPVTQTLGKQADVLVVPDGRLLEVSFGALPKDDDTYLVEHLKLAYLPYPAAVLNTVATGGKASGAFVAGDLDYRTIPGKVSWARSQWSQCGVQCQKASKKQQEALAQLDVDTTMGETVCGYDAEWSALPATQVETVAKRLGEATGEPAWLVTGAAAQEQAVRAALPGKKVIHLATHGFYSPAKRCGKTALAGKRGARLLGNQEASAPIDPLRLSALVLSGANKTKKNDMPVETDGVLSARDIVSLDLRGTELVTLAACQTGRGSETAGEGALGLARAFLVAGANTTVVSQWKVPGKKTVALFDKFYELALQDADNDEDSTSKRLRPAEALRQAQIEQIETHRKDGHKHSAFLWGAFVPVSNGI